MVMRKRIFDELGGFDASFFAHQEEIDLCWRIKKAGYKVFTVGSARVYHLGGGTLSYVNPHKTYLNFRNNLIMLLKNDSLFNVVWKFPLRLLLDGIAGVRFFMEGKPKAAFAIIKAHGSVYKNLRKTCRSRKESRKKISRIRIGSERMAGKYGGVVIWDYFIRARKKFSDLKKNA